MVAYVVAGLTFGDEGKGTIVDHLVRATGAKKVVRYNGGPQAGHNVVTADGRWHCFAQLGAGSFVPGTETFLARQMFVELENLIVEAERFGESVLERVTIDPRCVLVTPMHKMVCQMKEVARGKDRKGSCGMGVGEAAVRSGGPTAGELAGLERLAEECLEEARALRANHPSAEMEQLHEYFIDRCRPAELYETYRTILERVHVAAVTPPDAAVFEGAQGALLDQTRGFVPYVTQSRTSYHNARELFAGELRKIGVLRAYGHRHGPGPFPTEDRTLEKRLWDPRNLENRWQGPFRVGHLDLVAVRRGIAINDGVDELALTNLDRLSTFERIRIYTDKGWIELPGWRRSITRARELAELPGEARRFLDLVEEELGVKIGIVSVGPDSASKIVA